QIGPAPAAIVADAQPDVDVVEITTYRSDRYNPESRKPEVTFGDVLEEDLLRRDFTINAMARDPLTGEIFDPYGGREDIERRLIRAVGDDPARRFDEDPLRMLRAARFAAQLGFEIEPATYAAIARQAGTLAKISKERIRDEFMKLLLTPNPALGIRLLVDLSLMPFSVPEVLELRGVSQQPGGRSKDVYEHVLRVVERSPVRPASRWAGLLHDIAKPRTRTVENGHVHFFGHDEVGAVMARDILRRLKFDRAFIDYVSRLVRMHMRANSYLPDWTDGAVRRLMLEAGDALPDLLDLSRADITSYRQDKVSRAVARINELEARCEWLKAEAERVPIKSPLDGNDLMELFGRGPGPWLRPVKDYLLGLVIDGQLAPDDRATAADLARRFLAEYEQRAQAEQPKPEYEPASQGSSTPAAAESHQRQEPGETTHARESRQKRAARVASRRQSRHAVLRPPNDAGLPSAHTQRAPRRRASNPVAPRNAAMPSPKLQTASRDEIIAFLDEYLQIGRFRDLGPNGLQVIGKADVRRVALGVSANLALIEAAVAQQADMIVVHHGLFIDRDPRPILQRQKRRLKLLFDADINLLGSHLPLDAHPEVGNNVQWLRQLGFEVEATEFGQYQGQWIGAIGVCPKPVAVEALVRRVETLAGSAPRVYAFGPRQVRRLAVVTGSAPGSLLESIARGCDAYLTGEVAEGTQALAQEEGANFIAAGHYNTERFGVQALGELLQQRFGQETVFVDIPNDA
ncbi:MAG TPA: Nif3-like dinuclear metal center hexameric protein, partial [Ktedonobacterales bacterium]|nr:Nif3-like dinuclear metal center hexameric protein [Ktedonobacterales bacterium]